jgi:transcriptional regulator with XRE-family HTH domain
MEPIDVTVKALLDKRRGDWQAIAKEAEVSHSWLSKFVRGDIPNPGYATLKKVHECLTRKKARA